MISSKKIKKSVLDLFVYIRYLTVPSIDKNYIVIALVTLFTFVLMICVGFDIHLSVAIINQTTRQTNKQTNIKDEDEESVHLLSVTCGKNCGSYKKKNDVGAMIRSIIAFGKPVSNTSVHFHLVLSNETFYNCTDRITKSIEPWLQQDKNENSWFNLHYLSYDSLMAGLNFSAFDNYLVNGYRKCAGFRMFTPSIEYFSNISKIIYLDTDVVMFNSADRIVEEWNKNWTTQQMIGVIGSGGRLYRDKNYEMNSGVLFFDLDKMRSNDFFANFSSLIKSRKAKKANFRCGDQGQLNYFCQTNEGSCREIDCGFNLVNGNYGEFCLPRFKTAKHAVFIHKNFGVHGDYTRILNVSNDLQWVRQFYATNMSSCQVERFTMREGKNATRHSWKHKYPETWKNFGGIGCPKKKNERNITII